MIDFLPENFQCNEAIRAVATQKLTALDLLADELPVYIVFDVRHFSVVYMSPKGLATLGITLDNIRLLGDRYFDRFFNQEDVDLYLPKFKFHLSNPDEKGWFTLFEEVYTDGDKLNWYLSASRPFIYDETGAVLLALTFAIPLDPDNHLTDKAERLRMENRLLKESHHRFASLTKREKQVLKCTAAGDTAEHISGKLFISEKTLKTHRRNIKRKIGAKTLYDVVKFAQAFNLA